MFYHKLLRDYLHDYAIPAMLEQGWALKPAKSHGWQKAARGADYHIDQPLRTHILNGLYAITRVLEYLDKHDYCHMSEGNFKRLLVLYTLHDAYKDPVIANTRAGNSEFDVSLQALEDLYQRMHLHKFVNLKAQDIRLASVSRLSPKVADLSSCSPEIIPLLNFVHLADAFASQQTARDCSTAGNYLREIVSGDDVTARQDARVSKRLGMAMTSQDVRAPLTLYYHELDEYRGLSTLLIHQCTEEVLQGLGFYPILYFANGNLYIGPENVTVDTEQLRKDVVNLLFTKVKQQAGVEKLAIAKEACDARKGMKIEKYAYLFCNLEDLLMAVQEETPLDKRVGFLGKGVLAKRVNSKKYKHVDEFYACYAIPPDTDADEARAKLWFAASKMVMVAENMATALITSDALEWLFVTFRTPTEIAGKIRQHRQTLSSGGVSDYCYIIAYYWLTAARFLEHRTWLEVDVAHVQQALIQHIAEALREYEKTEHLLNFVEKTFGFRSDANNYLTSYLVFSFDPQRTPEESPLKEYEKERKKSHKRVCTICNRLISPQMRDHDIKTTIANQQALVFSNKRLPTEKLTNEMMVWCPMCYLEFMLRKLSGQGYPEGSDYNSSYCLYLYVLPDYSFTPQLWEDTSRELLRNFLPKETVVSRLALRGSKDDPALPTHWLERRTVDQSWLEQVQQMFAKQAERMKTPTKGGKRRTRGDRIAFSLQAPNYTLITYANAVPERTDKNLAPTHIEVWTKALYAAALIHLLTGVRVYITDKPYLSITRPEQMKTIIEMEGLHPLLYSLLPLHLTANTLENTVMRPSEGNARLPLAALSTLLDLLAAVWEINAALYQGRSNERNLDKQVASILEEVRVNYLAGATLYKACERDQEKKAYPTFTRACQLLLPQYGEVADPVRRALYDEGYELMLDKEGGDLMNLAQHITNTSLRLYVPSAKKEGRAHRFENLFRTGVEAIKQSANIDKDELVARVAGTVLKRLERIIEGKGYCPIYGDERIEIVQQFADILVKELFHQRCGGSVSKLTHEENHLADAVYFLTYQKVNQYWKDKQEHSETTNEEMQDE